MNWTMRRHKRLAAAGALLVVVAAIGAGLLYFHSHRPAILTPYPRELAQVNFAVAGDVIPHGAVRAAASAAGDGAQGWGALFADVADVFQHADFGFVNLETPVAPAHSRGTREFLFDAPVALVDALKANGIKIVSSANNHMMDQGWAGFAETREHLRERGMLFAGTGDTAQQSWQPVITEANGIKVGWLGMTRWLNGNRNPDKDDQPHVNFFPYPDESKGAPPADKASLDEASVLNAVIKARSQCDFLVISIHWGTEYAPAPRPADVEMAHQMLDAGASVIVGHHPHVLQPVETYKTADGRDTVIFFSLGNFLSNQSRTYVDGLMPDKAGDPRDSMIGLFSAVRKDYGPAGVRVELGHVGVLPVWGENNHNELGRRGIKSPVIHPVLIDREMPRLQARLDELNKLSMSAKPLTAEQKKQFIDLTSHLKLLTDRRALLLERVGDEYVVDPPKLAGKQ
jgi:poly-gamma-glutamate synthesis protein (capsule biosynthesis protein)